MDDGKLGDDMTLEAIAKRLDTISADITSIRSDIKSIDGKFTSLDGKVTSLDGKVTALDGKVDALDQKMKIEFEATRSMIKLGFENVQMLDEKIGRRFDTTDRANEDKKTLLEAALVSLRRDLAKAKRS